MLVIDSPADLEPIIVAAVAKTLAAIQEDQARIGERFAFSEPEAARLISMKPHQLRDERLRGRIGASGICKNGIRYTREDLWAYRARNRSEPRI